LRILLVVYDNDAYIHWFPQGLAYLAAVLENNGYEVHIYNQDLHHYPEEHLTEFLDKNRFDVVGVGVIAGYYQYRKLIKISEAVNRSKYRPYYILGGHGPSPEPEFFLRRTLADAVVIGEGEVTILELLEAFANKTPLSKVQGIAYQNGDQTFINPRRPLIKDVDSIPFPAYHLFPVDYYRLLRFVHTSSSDFVMPVLSGRGCTFTCTFCYRIDEGFRPRSSESIIEEIKFLKINYGITYISFSDELLMSSPERTIGLCSAFIKAGLNIKWTCNGRLNYATTDVLKIMKEAGCVFINYGIEAFDDTVLKNMKKALSTRQIVNGIEATLKSGISPGFNIIFGNIGDTKETLQKGVDFLLKYDDCAQMRTIRPVTPYPGSPLFATAVEMGLVRDCEDFYENKHVNSDLMSINFTELTDNEFHMSLYEANRKLIQNYFNKKCSMTILEAEKLYIQSNSDFRGFRHT
jgi:anaerobic magnesium-protoporphyrin IX monomethyl ester cyclase